jgi:uncharacterized protein (DUF433 family)
VVADKESISDLGSGIYTLPDVATILRLPQEKVRRWMNGYWNAKFGQSTQTAFSEGTGRERITNFLTLIEFFTFYQLRDAGVSTQRIIKAHQVLEMLLHMPYPFASSSILTDGRQVLFTGEAGAIIQADESLQITIAQVTSPFCKKIDFDNQTLAGRFFPVSRESSVVIDPERKFGQPIIDGTSILTQTIYNLHRGGEPVALICKLYDLAPGQVEDVIAFHRQAA